MSTANRFFASRKHLVIIVFHIDENPLIPTTVELSLLALDCSEECGGFVATDGIKLEAALV